MRSHRTILGVRVAACLGAIFATFAARPADAVVNSSTIFISEFHYDNTGTDSGECIEIAGPAGTNLSGYTILLYNGAAGQGTVYTTINLSGVIPNATGGYGAIAVAATGIQNGAPDGIALVGPSGLIEFISYEGAFTGVGGAAGGLVSTDIGVQEPGSDPVGMSLARTGTGLRNVELTWAGPRTATCNGTLDFTPGTVTFTPRTIPEIQGVGPVSPFVGQAVRTEGVVTAVFSGLGGFYIQASDGNPNTSDGIFVQSAAPVTPGQTVRVDGTVFEQDQQTASDGETAIQAVTVTVTGSAAVPAATDLPLPESANDDMERWEGMLVQVRTTDSDRMRVAQTYFLGRYGQLTLNSPNASGVQGPLIQPTQLFDPSTSAASQAQQLEASHQLRLLVLDDGQDVSPDGDNPATVPYINCTEAGAPPTRVVRAGDFAGALVGVLDWGLITTPASSNIHDYRLQPLSTSSVTFTTGNARPTSPPNPSAAYEVVGTNILNYFTTMRADDGNARGAFDCIEFRRQTEKLTAALCAMNADVYGIAELQNNALAIQVLVNGNDDAGDPAVCPPGADAPQTILGLNDVCPASWTAVNTPNVQVVGTDAIKVGFVYKATTTEAVGNPAVIPATVGSQPAYLTFNRPSIAQTFRRTSNGGVFTAVMNHWKSKGSACDANIIPPADVDTGDLAGECNLTRRGMAQAIVNWIATNPTGTTDPDYLILGDLNSYTQEAPLDVLRSAGFVDLVARDEGVQQSQDFIFDGKTGNLGYMFASASLAAQVANTEEWHINSDEATVLDFEDFFNQVGCFLPTNNNASEPRYYRSADHDPLSASINLAPSGPAPVPALPVGALGAIGLGLLSLGLRFARRRA